MTFQPRKSALPPPSRTVANRFKKVNRLNGLNDRWSASLASRRIACNACSFGILARGAGRVCLISKQPNRISAAVKFPSKILGFYVFPIPVILRISPSILRVPELRRPATRRLDLHGCFATDTQNGMEMCQPTGSARSTSRSQQGDRTLSWRTFHLEIAPPSD